MKSLSKYLLVIGIVWCSVCIAPISFAQTSRLWDVEMSFCTNDQITNEVDLTTKAGDVLPICVQLRNKTDQKVTINVEFVDAIITDDASKNRACNAPDRAKTQFANFIQAYDHTVVLGSGETIKKNYTIRYWASFAWLSHGCVMYNVIGDHIDSNDMFGVVVRSAKFVDIFVSSGRVKQAIDVPQDPKIEKVGDEYTITLWISNNGNIDEKLHITTSISNMLGFQQTFEFDMMAGANTWIEITTPSFLLPTYGWAFLLKSTIVYTPEVDFNITSKKPSTTIYAWWTKTVQNMIFFWTRQTWVVIFLLLRWLRSIYRKRNKREKK